jgi:hypothetical protein
MTRRVKISVIHNMVTRAHKGEVRNGCHAVAE